nr:prepilin-type N-terminal cleavage/methylation domain-containing protein [Rhodoferax sp.]
MTRHAHGVSRPQLGFTLLELLISITLLGLILVLLFGGLRLGVRSWDAVQKQVDSLNTVRSVENFLRSEIALTYPYRWKQAPGQRMAFLGERNKLSFVTQLPSRVGAGGLYAVSVELEHLDSGKRVVWRQLPLNPRGQDFSELAQAKEMVLAATELNTVEDIWLTYYGRESESAPPRWLDRWESDVRLPMLVRIQVKFADNTDWPDFIVAPMLSSEVVR